MKRFRYGLDPLCLVGCAAYALNRWILKAHWDDAFLHSTFNDLWLMPCALPWVLWLQRRLGLRHHDGMPTPGEILSHLALWSVLFEVIGPRVMRVTGDVGDVIAYAVGGGVAWWWWHRQVVPTETNRPRAVSQRGVPHGL